MEAESDCEEWLLATKLHEATSVTAACVGRFAGILPGLPGALMLTARSHQPPCSVPNPVTSGIDITLQLL